MIQEQYERLEAEGAEFFLDAQADRAEAKSFHKASLRTFGWIDVAMKLTLNPHTQNRRMRHPESSYYLSSVPPAGRRGLRRCDRWGGRPRGRCREKDEVINLPGELRRCEMR